MQFLSVLNSRSFSKIAATLFIALFFSNTLFAQSHPFAGGTGVGGDPFQIATVAQLDSVRNYPDSMFVLTADLDLDVAPYNSGLGWEPIPIFRRTLNGDGHVISGLFIDRNQGEVGLIGHLTAEGTVENIGLENINITGNNAVGGIIGSSDGDIDNSYTTGTVTGNTAVGGLVGVQSESTSILSRSYSQCTVSGVKNVGGAIGELISGSIAQSYASGDVSASSFFSNVGGLVGRLAQGAVGFSFAIGDVSGTREVGGLVGLSQVISTVTNSYAWGDVTGTGHTVGGLVGSQTHLDRIEDSYSIGAVNGGANAGGLVGGNSSIGTVINSYWNTETAGVTDLGINGEGRTTAEMKFPFAGNTYVEWGFVTIWGGAGVNADFVFHNSYPFLLWQGFENEVEALFAGGDGTAEDPFQIETAEHLDNVRHRLDSNFVMIDDIDLDISPFNEGWNPIGTGDIEFRGSFDGQNHTITGLKVIQPGLANRGLFGAVGGNSAETDTLIQNLKLESVNVTGLNFVGGLVGFLSNATVSNCSVSGTIVHSGSTSNGFSFGGLVGILAGGGIHNSSSSANVTARVDVGGLVGQNNTGTISDSHASGNVSGEVRVGGLAGESTFLSKIIRSSASGKVNGEKITDAGVHSAGGLVGLNNGDIDQSNASGDILGSDFIDELAQVGGLVGHNFGVINEAYATGSVSSDNFAGGLVGLNADSIKNSFSAGSVAGNEVNAGGLTGGTGGGGIITNSYWDIGRSGRMTSNGGTGLTSEQMLQQEFFNGLGFGEDDEFDIVEGFSFPFLKNVSQEVLLAIEIDGNEGWRMMGTPFADSLKNFFDEFWKQGMHGADTEGGLPNILRWEELQQSFVAPEAVNEIMPPGQGHIIHVFEDDDPTAEGVDGGFPKWKYTSASKEVDTFTFNITATDENENEVIDGDEGWNLLANPFPFPIDVDALLTAAETADANVNQNVYLWNTNAGSSGEYVTLAQGNNESIAPLQGFFMRFMTPGLDAGFDVGPQALRTTSAEFLKQRNGEVNQVLRLSIEGQGMQQNWDGVFHPDADPRKNVYYLPPLSANKLSLYSNDERGKYVKHFFEAETGAEFEIPLHLETTNQGIYTISAEMDFPEGWHIELIDNMTGTTSDLRQATDYEFNIQTGSSPADLPRFQLRIKAGTVVSSDPNPNLPKTIALAQNYPNPFNPSTVISYQLPVSSEVRLEVFDMLGREVAVLVNGQVKAGYHQVNFNADNLASGMYIYRLVAADEVIIKKLTLIK